MSGRRKRRYLSYSEGILWSRRSRLGVHQQASRPQHKSPAQATRLNHGGRERRHGGVTAGTQRYAAVRKHP